MTINKRDSEMINIVCNIDDRYLQYCIVMLTSLFANNKHERFHIHIIAGELSDSSKQALSDTVELKYKQRLSLYIVGDKILELCPIDKEGYISISTYYRCFLVSILPSDISKVIYLDGDLIVHVAIREFLESDI